MALPVVRTSVKSALLLAFLATLAAAYFSNTPIPLFLTHLKEIALASVVLWSAGGWGNQLIRRAPALTALESFLFSVSFGLGGLSLLMILLGVLYAWIAAGAWVILLAGILLSREFLHTLKTLILNLAKSASLTRDSLWPATGILIAGVLSFILALAPITYYDSLVYHFALPATYLRAHHWVALPGLIYSAFPQTLEMLWTLGLLIGDQTVANLIAWSLGVLLIVAVFAYGRRFFDRSVGWIASALLALMPSIMLLSSGGYVDVGLALFSFLALYAACLWINEPVSEWLVCAGAAAGWAIGTKYTGVLVAGLVFLLIVGQHRGIRSILLFAVSAVVIIVPWLIKNLLFVGNPIFPFFYHWGIKALNPWVNQAAAGYFAGVSEYYSRSIWALPGVLWDAAVNGTQFGRGMDVLGDYGWIPLIGFLPAIWLASKRMTMLTRLLLFAAGYFIVWAVTRPVLRFLLPLSPVLAIAVAYGWVYGIRTQIASVRWTCTGFMACFLASGLILFSYTTSVLNSFDVALGFETKSDYLARRLNYYLAAEFINTQTPADSRVYVMGDQRGYYYQRDTWITPVFSENPLTQWADTAATAAALKQKLKEAGITHLVVNRAEFDRLKASYPSLRFNAQGERNWSQLLDSELKPLYRDPACQVYAL